MRSGGRGRGREVAGRISTGWTKRKGRRSPFDVRVRVHFGEFGFRSTQQRNLSEEKGGKGVGGWGKVKRKGHQPRGRAGVGVVCID